ncbi:MAG: pentapeptide repeat-containing protein, partial [Symploca sp. SIO1A3]|nr:pentapeptide repeat-containing protein [Symploca sp. SIO1A3]
MADLEMDLASLVSRIEQIEERQEIVAKYTVKVKRQLDNLTEQFNTRPELQQMESLQEVIANLSEAMADLHQQQKPQLSTSEVVEESFPELNEAEEIDDFAGESQEPAISAEEFCRRVEEGERDFTGINLAEVDLTGQHFPNGLNLSQANLTKTKLGRTSLRAVNMIGANLTEAELSKADLFQANLSYTNLEKANLRKADLSAAKLEEVNLQEANLSGVELQQASLYGANLSEANLSEAELIQANLAKADLAGANLIQA